MLCRVTYCLLGRLVSSRLLLLLLLPDRNWGSLGHTPLNRFRGVNFSVLKLARKKSEWNRGKNRDEGDLHWTGAYVPSQLLWYMEFPMP